MEINEIIDKIIRFFTQSPILGVIILGLIGSFFSKKKKGDSKNRMPSFGGDQGNPYATQSSDSNQHDEDDEEYDERKETAASSESSRGFKNTPTPEPSYSAFESLPSARDLNNEGSMERDQLIRSLSAVASERAESLAERERSEFNVSRSELAKSVVWAEILGPPRAKKPYGRR